jgi:RNA polymerase sigma-70 factor (ECF subfamily)
MSLPARPASANDASEPISDEEIVRSVLAGQAALFELIMRRHNQRLFRVARGILHNDADAEDAVQRAYLAAYQALGQFAGQARFSTWLTRIAIHAALGLRRKVVRRGETDLSAQGDSLMTEPAQQDDPEQQTARRELTTLLERAIDELPEIYRVVVMLRQVQQLSVAETAACLEVSEEVVKVRLHRGTALLRAAMAAHLDALAPQAFAFLGARCDRIVANVLERIAALPPPSDRT